MKKTISLTIITLLLAFSTYALSPLTGTMSVCAGSYTTIYEDSLYVGGTWSSSNLSVATDTSLGGGACSIYGVSAGACTITYTLGGSYVTASFTVNPLPAAISGVSSFCVGTTTTFSDATPGGIWTSSYPSSVTIGSLTGVATGVSTGWSYITYTIPTGCNISTSVTVVSTAPPIDTVAGSSTVCLGSTTTLTDGTPGGTWSSSDPSIATVSSTGVVTGISSGSFYISYTIPASCGSSLAYRHMNCTSTTYPGYIYGSSSISVGSTTTYYESVPGGIWSSSNPSVVTIGSATGLVTGVSLGSAVISYEVPTGCSGPAYATQTITDTVYNRISGYVGFDSSYTGHGIFKVWLITYNPTTHLLEAIDSITDSAYIYTYTSLYYEFGGEPADSYRVKAAFYPDTFSSTGYVPTYHTSSYYWSTADVFYHTITSTDDNKNINMVFGSVSAGPGFIAGDVTMGANKGSSGSSPSAGLLMLALNATGNLVQKAYTDGSGHYSFSNLPLGTYTIYPELMNYNTTAYTGITLTTTSSSMAAANFGQHTISKTIIPIVTGVENTAYTVSSAFAFPNPTNGKLNIQWTETTNEKAVISINDATGREVYTTSINMTQGTGTSQVDLSGLTYGTYLISVKSTNINYNNKIVLAHLE